MAVNNLNKVKIPGTGITAARPSNPAVGDTFYNGTLGRLEIYTSQGWMALNAPAATPTGVTATDAGSGRAYNNGSASIAFTPATSGGLPTSYVVTSSPGSYTATGSVSPIIVSGQQSNTSYTYTVVASNDYATASTSSASSAVTATTVPQAPSLTGSVESLQVPLTITPAATGGSAITGYSITSSPATTTQTTSSTNYTFTGLTNNTAYTFTAVAINANGSSAASAASNSVTPSPTVTVTGGTLYTSGAYKYRKFTSSGVLTISAGTLNSFEVLVVAGGGGGGGNIGAGGGAGGFRYYDYGTLGNGSYTVTIGAGGGGGSNGGNSTFDTITSLGGGYGGGFGGTGGTGGSGGGGYIQ